MNSRDVASNLLVWVQVLWLFQYTCGLGRMAGYPVSGHSQKCCLKRHLPKHISLFLSSDITRNMWTVATSEPDEGWWAKEKCSEVRVQWFKKFKKVFLSLQPYHLYLPSQHMHTRLMLLSSPGQCFCASCFCVVQDTGTAPFQKVPAETIFSSLLAFSANVSLISLKKTL